MSCALRRPTYVLHSDEDVERNGGIQEAAVVFVHAEAKDEQSAKF